MQLVYRSLLFPLIWFVLNVCLGYALEHDLVVERS